MKKVAPIDPPNSIPRSISFSSFLAGAFSVALALLYSCFATLF
jgi:hypothetical protein